MCIIFLKLYKVDLQTKKESKGLGMTLSNWGPWSYIQTDLVWESVLRFYFLKHIFIFFKVAFVILASYRVIWESFFGKVVPYFNEFCTTKFKMHHYFICHIVNSCWYHLLFQRCKNGGGATMGEMGIWIEILRKKRNQGRGDSRKEQQSKRPSRTNGRNSKETCMCGVEYKRGKVVVKEGRSGEAWLYRACGSF